MNLSALSQVMADHAQDLGAATDEAIGFIALCSKGSLFKVRLTHQGAMRRHGGARR
jgi:hypothetical protein